ANRFVASEDSPIADVAIEPIEVTGVPASRVHITLAQAVPHRVRSDRNTILVDFDKPSTASASPVPSPARRGQDAMAALERATATQAAAQAQAQTAAPAAPADQSGGRRFTGNPVSLDFQGADLRAVLRTFSEISGLNIVIDPR